MSVLKQRFADPALGELVLARDALGKLSRTMAEMALRAERRAVGRGRVNRLLGDAALANDVKRYRADRWETLALIGRLRRPPGSARRAVSVPGHTGPDCRVCAEARRLETSRAASTPGSGLLAADRYCRGCGALSDWCRCGTAVRTQW
jgi:hypothetical protein